jgi:pyruvyl transferase EpsO
MLLGILMIAAPKLDLGDQTHLTGILLALLANVSMALRNCISKIYCKSTGGPLDYSRVCLAGVVLLYIPTMLCYNYFKTSMSASAYLLGASVFHVAYNSLSFLVLSSMDSLNHSMIKFTSRCSIVLIVSMFFSMEYDVLKIMGTLLCLFGSFLFMMAKTDSKLNLLTCIKMVLVGLFVSSLYLALLRIGSSTVLEVKTFHSTAADTRDSRRLQCLNGIRTDLFASLGNSFTDKRLYLLDVPAHNNFGDSFIVVGEAHLLKRQISQIPLCTLDPEYRTTSHRCNKTIIAQYVGSDGIVVSQGGGNFGDLWPQAHLPRVFHFVGLVRSGVRNLVLFPQSIFYVNGTESKQLYQDEMILDWVSRRANLTLMWRQQDSYEFAKTHFLLAHHVLAPDSAFAIPPIDCSGDPEFDIMFLLRFDQESKIKSGNIKGKQVTKQIHKKLAGVTWIEVDWPRFASVGLSLNDSTPFESTFQERLRLGAEMICKARVVVTDRLHASIMANLVGRPVVYIDNSYNKISKTRATSLRNEDCSEDILSTFPAKNLKSAAIKALKLLQSTGRI